VGESELVTVTVSVLDPDAVPEAVAVGDCVEVRLAVEEAVCVGDRVWEPDPDTVTDAVDVIDTVDVPVGVLV